MTVTVWLPVASAKDSRGVESSSVRSACRTRTLTSLLKSPIVAVVSPVTTFVHVAPSMRVWLSSIPTPVSVRCRPGKTRGSLGLTAMSCDLAVAVGDEQADAGRIGALLAV